MLRKRAARLSNITGKVYRSKLDIEQGQVTAAQAFKTALLRPWVLLFFEPIVLALSIYAAIIYGEYWKKLEIVKKEPLTGFKGHCTCFSEPTQLFTRGNVVGLTASAVLRSYPLRLAWYSPSPTRFLSTIRPTKKNPKLQGVLQHLKSGCHLSLLLESFYLLDYSGLRGPTLPPYIGSPQWQQAFRLALVWFSFSSESPTT